MKNLKHHGLNIENILNTDINKLWRLIYVVNFNQKKVTTIKNITKILKEKYDSKVPEKLED